MLSVISGSTDRNMLPQDSQYIFSESVTRDTEAENSLQPLDAHHKYLRGLKRFAEHFGLLQQLLSDVVELIIPALPLSSSPHALRLRSSFDDIPCV